jgi:hypothetical protein
MAVTVEAQAHAAAGAESIVGRRVQTVRHGQGNTAWAERLATAVVEMTGLTTYAQYGTPAHWHHRTRRDFQPNSLYAVVVRKGYHREYRPAGKMVFLPNAVVAKPRQPFANDDDRSLIAKCGIRASQPPWSLTHTPQRTARAVRGPVMFTELLCALATALAAPAPGPHAGAGDQLCPGLLRHLS